MKREPPARPAWPGLVLLLLLLAVVALVASCAFPTPEATFITVGVRQPRANRRTRGSPVQNPVAVFVGANLVFAPVGIAALGAF